MHNHKGLAPLYDIISFSLSPRWLNHMTLFFLHYMTLFLILFFDKLSKKLTVQ